MVQNPVLYSVRALLLGQVRPRAGRQRRSLASFASACGTPCLATCCASLPACLCMTHLLRPGPCSPPSFRCSLLSTWRLTGDQSAAACCTWCRWRGARCAGGLPACWGDVLVAACCSKANAACAAAARRHAAAPHGPAAPQVKAYRAPAFLATHWVNAFESADGRFLYLDASPEQLRVPRAPPPPHPPPPHPPHTHTPLPCSAIRGRGQADRELLPAPPHHRPLPA